ncbi:hypothetical protein [Methanobrevibacter sp.]|uniref:hypothetical protein n=1 Tax=Methanobrevibacter sp. TaxID=66852 RepID=UPI002E776ADF|nr:hypothetical protein [Methanobrevibacter sp.]
MIKMEGKRIVRAVCSFIIPGIGQFLNGHFGRGILFLIIFIGLLIALSAVLGRVLIAYVIGIVYRLLIAFEAYYSYDDF